MHRIIDWNELWKALHVSSPERAEKDRNPAAHWDKRAAAYRRVTRDERSATEQELAILGVQPGETVLDMGAGTGRLAVPVSRTAAHVTALDPSEGMLAILRERMAAEGLTNYSCLRKRWEDATIGRDVEPHDIVVAAFSLGFYDLAAALEKLDAAARRAVYIFWHAGEFFFVVLGINIDIFIFTCTDDGVWAFGHLFARDTDVLAPDRDTITVCHIEFVIFVFVHKCHRRRLAIHDVDKRAVLAFFINRGGVAALSVAGASQPLGRHL